MRRSDQQKASVVPITRVFVSFALLHSALASSPAKRWVASVIGLRFRNGVYRFTFNVLSVLLLIPGAIWFFRLPDRELYRIPRPWSQLFRAIQLLSIAFAISAARAVGVAKITGISSLVRLLQRTMPRAEPEAQGPRLDANELVVKGPFKWTRHPLNLAPIGVFFFFPQMTVNRLTLAMLSLLYLVLGSLHEERRLLQAYGEKYRHYQKSGVPFYIPIRYRR